LSKIGGPGICQIGSVVGNILTSQKFSSDIFPFFLLLDLFELDVVTENGSEEKCCSVCSVPNTALVRKLTIKIPQDRVFNNLPYTV